MKLVSDHVLQESGKTSPKFTPHYSERGAFDLSSPQAFTAGHPFEHYKYLRENAPISWSPMLRNADGFWSVVRYEDIKTAELAPDVFSSQRGSINMGMPPKYLQFPKKLYPAAINNLINLDAPQHMELRLQQKDFFIPKYVATLKHKVGRKIDQLLDAMEREYKATGTPIDFVKHFSEQLPLFTLCEMLGVDEEDRPKIVRWMHYLEMAQQVVSAPWGTFKNDPLFIPRYIKNVNEMFAYGERVMADRRANPRNDLLTVIAQSTLGAKTYLKNIWMDHGYLLFLRAMIRRGIHCQEQFGY